MVASFDAKLAAEGRPNGPAHGNGADPDLDLSARHKAKAAAQASTWPLPEFIGDLAQAILPPREWLYGRHYVREFMSVTVGLSGAGKSNLAIAEVAAMASHRNLVGDLAEEPLRIWYHNGEDPLDELKRRFLAAMRHYEVGGAEVADRLIITSGRDIKLLVAEPGLRSHHLARGEDVIDWIKRTIAAREIDVMIVDPLVSTHQVDENSNVHMNAVAEIFAEVARDCRCAIDLVQHSRKAIGEEITIDHARGASALIAASRSARVLNTMSREEADGFGVSERRRFFRVENGKSSMYVPADEAEWFEIRSHKLDNGPGGSEGDSVGVVTEWEPPGPFRDIVQHDIDKALWSVAKGQEDGSLWRLASNAADWVGLPIAEALGIHTQTAEGRHRLARIVETWIDEKLLRVVLKPDKYRHMREFVDAASVR
jgi:hypothetical protein